MEKSSMNIKLRKQYLGLGLIGWIVAIPITLILLLILAVGFYEGRKAYWDHKVTKMCEEDGGVTVYERVELTRKEFENIGGNEYGQIPVPSMRLTKDNYPYYSELLTIQIRDGNPKVYKNEGRIFRKSDNKLLGLMISYGRSGGDFPTGFHPSNFGCADLKTIRLDVEKQVFVIEGER